MNVFELNKLLSEEIPSSLSCEWDKDGFEACPDPDREVKRVLIALDVTKSVIDKAINEKFDVIVSHHPIFFGALYDVNVSNIMGCRAVNLIKNSIAVMSFHTRLDALCGGVNDTLAEKMGLNNVTAVDADSDKIMRIGELDCEMEAVEFAQTVKDRLSVGGKYGKAPISLIDAGKKVKRVALIGGSGGDYVELAKNAGADTYVTGDLKYHQYLSADEYGINIVSAGHFFTEYPVCYALEKKIKALCPDIETEVYFSNKIQTI